MPTSLEVRDGSAPKGDIRAITNPVSVTERPLRMK
jgi:hypothetical protein